MLHKIRPNIYIGDANAGDATELMSKGITTVVLVADEMVPMLAKDSKLKIFKLGLLDGPNYGFVKDLACHIVKYAAQNGETVLVQGKTGLKRPVFVAARTICEIENKPIYEIFQDIKKIEKTVDLSKVYF